MKRLIITVSLASWYVISLKSEYFPHDWLSDIPGLRSSFNPEDHILNPYKSGKIRVIIL
jgi:hypothetical protein